MSHQIVAASGQTVPREQEYLASPPQQQSGYPPSQQQSGYPPQQKPGYPPQQQTGYGDGAAPPYYPTPQQHQQPPLTQPAPVVQPQMVQQQSTSTNVNVVMSQPATASYRVVQRTGDHFLTLSIILTVICCLCGTWYSLFCTIPAILIASQAKDAEARGDEEGAKSKGYIALGCNIAACVSWVLALVIWIIVVAVEVQSSSNSQ